MQEPGKPPYERLILICVNERELGEDACANRGSAAIAERLKQEAKDRGLKGRVRVSRTQCLGLCKIGPNIVVWPEGIWYHGVTMEDVPTIVQRHLDSAAATGS